MKLALLSFVFAVGTILPAQAGLNAELRRFAGHPLLAGVVNFAVGLAALVVVTAIARVPLPAVARLGEAPWWSWLGGLCGATLVTTAVVAAPRLGASLLIAALVTGQLASSLVIDHFGWVGYPVRPIAWARVVGVVLLAGGVLLIERTS